MLRYRVDIVLMFVVLKYHQLFVTVFTVSVTRMVHDMRVRFDVHTGICFMQLTHTQLI